MGIRSAYANDKVYILKELLDEDEEYSEKLMFEKFLKNKYNLYGELDATDEFKVHECGSGSILLYCLDKFEGGYYLNIKKEWNKINFILQSVIDERELEEDDDDDDVLDEHIVIKD